MSPPDSAEVFSTVREHIRDQWPDVELQTMAWTLGSFESDYPDFRTVIVPPHGDDDFWTYVSMGAWVGGAERRHAHEFVLMSAVEEALHVEKMAALVRREADPDVPPITAGRAIPLGDPWLEGSPCDHALFDELHTFPPEFCCLNFEDLSIHFLWMVPITAGEYRYWEEHGADALRERFGEAQVDITQPVRASVV
jgi:suppressor of fused protein SUFU